MSGVFRSKESEICRIVKGKKKKKTKENRERWYPRYQSLCAPGTFHLQALFRGCKLSTPQSNGPLNGQSYSFSLITSSSFFAAKPAPKLTRQSKWIWRPRPPPPAPLALPLSFYSSAAAGSANVPVSAFSSSSFSRRCFSSSLRCFSNARNLRFSSASRLILSFLSRKT